jgi:hypothetical protein
MKFMNIILTIVTNLTVKDFFDYLSDLAIVVAVISLLLQRRQFKKTNKLALKDRFIGSTARYVKIQETLLSNSTLSSLNVDICLTRVNRTIDSEKHDSSETFKKFKEHKDNLKSLTDHEKMTMGKELALCAIMFQLMEDVWTMHDLNKNSWFLTQKEEETEAEIFAGWDALFCDWMQTSPITENWEFLKHQYTKKFVEAFEKRYLIEQCDKNSVGQKVENNQ